MPAHRSDCHGRPTPITAWWSDSHLTSAVWKRSGGSLTGSDALADALTGGMSSDRQGRGVIGLLVVQGAGLNLAYLNETASEVGLDELLSRALAQAELEEG